ncbi:hypothetical protein KUV80_13980 [Fictibacillus nanhaiensis]|uniref:hypothetical protein n=1 Tax=Fictibacillus nanhaiensis TaxID=742169 RepID=UPI001C974DA3|nr:hypothetical protein [Fictibacillus nanhaiensis]MBY6037776.1 hypothetical protein [Fictibacillus nanhaiensis]
MKKIRKISWMVTGLFLVFFVLYLGPDLWTKHKAKHSAGQFLNDVKNDNLEQAFNRIYFFDSAFDEDVTIKKDAARKSWVTRIKQLKNKGTYIKSFERLRIRLNDGLPAGSVDMVMVENGKERVYKDVYLSFQNDKGEWKVGMLQTMQEKSWEKTLGGQVIK